MQKDNNTIVETVKTTKTQPDRIDYLDYLKGFAILWIVWWHAGVPVFAQPYYHVPIFFFISGMFFKRNESFKEVVHKNIKRVGIPFLFFYTISYPYRMIVYLWDHRTLAGFRWNCILDIFRIEWRADYLYVNVPLWFLVCLFSLQIGYYFISKFPDWAIWLIAVGSAVLFVYTQYFPTPFMINDALHYITYFAVGNLVGYKLIAFLNNNKKRTLLIIGCTILYVLIKITSNYQMNGFLSNILLHAATFTFIFFIFAVFSFIGNGCKKSVLKFFGLNSLTVLGLHVPVLIIYQRFFHKVCTSFGLWEAFVCTLCTIITLYPIIILLNKYTPKAIGKNTSK